MHASPTSSDPAAEAPLRQALAAELEPQFNALRRFLDRRMSELSAELHAGIELADQSEARIAGDIARMQAQIAQLIAVPASGARNSGLELEAVVQVTEAAANTIMEAAEAIGDWIAAGRDVAQASAIVERVNAIFEACAFQDLTGQRIRRAIQHLQQVEGALRTLSPADAAETPRVEVRTQARTIEAAPGSADLGQADIDALLNG
jgi:chemotaxis protein CheZ